MAVINKKTNTENGGKTRISTANDKAIETQFPRDLPTERIVKRSEDEKYTSEADRLTLRAWKKTFENRKKAE